MDFCENPTPHIDKKMVSLLYVFVCEFSTLNYEKMFLHTLHKSKVAFYFGFISLFTNDYLVKILMYKLGKNRKFLLCVLEGDSLNIKSIKMLIHTS